MPTAAFAQTAQPASANAAAAMQNCAGVLLGKRDYLRCGETGSARATFTPKVKEWYGYEFPKATSFDRFSVTDVDADGLPELLLELLDTEGYPFGYELFRYENGEVYGYPFVVRAMEQVTREGDVFASSGANDNGWYQLRFSGDQVQWITTCHTQSNADHSAVHYWIGDQEVAKAEYDARAAQISSREPIVWLPYAEDALRTVVAKFTQPQSSDQPK